MRFSVLVRGAALTVAIVGAAVISTLVSFNHFGEVQSSFDGKCAPVTGVAGPEDIQTAPTLHKAFISSLDRRAGDRERGAILAVALDDPLDAENWRDRTNGIPAKFRPLGVSYFEAGDVRRLFVVNEATNAVEVFSVSKSGDLEHLESISERRLTSANDVAAAGPRSFYVSNDLAPGRSTLFGRLQFLARAATGQIFYYDGTAFRSAAAGLRFANGVTLSSDGTKLYAAETAGNAIKIFDRDVANGSLTLVHSMRTPVAADNMNFGTDGALWIAGSPKPLLVAQTQRDESVRPPSQVIRLAEDENGDLAISTVFLDAGDGISASTTAAMANGKLLIGALLENKYLICDLPEQ